MEAMANRPKFLRYYGGLQLRVEQIGPDLWVGSIYIGCLPPTPTHGSDEPMHLWDPPFTSLTEEDTKRAALATAFHRIGPAPKGSDEEWRCLSDIADEDWSRTLRDLGFPGYPAREGMERWSGF